LRAKLTTLGQKPKMFIKRTKMTCYGTIKYVNIVWMPKEMIMKDYELRPLLTGAVFLFLFIFVTSASGIAADFVSVSRDGVNLRSGPDTKYNVLYELPAGYPLKILSRKGEWLKVRDFENDRGWIFSSLVSKTPYVIVKVKQGNVRSGPGTNYDKVGSVVREVILKQVKRDGNWVKIQHPQLSGWVYKNLIWP